MRWFFELIFGARVDFIVTFKNNVTRQVRAKNFSDAVLKAYAEYGHKPIRVEPQDYENILRDISFGKGHNYKKVQVSTNQAVYCKDTSKALMLVDTSKVKTKIVSLAWIKEDTKRRRNQNDLIETEVA